MIANETMFTMYTMFVTVAYKSKLSQVDFPFQQILFKPINTLSSVLMRHIERKVKIKNKKTVLTLNIPDWNFLHFPGFPFSK